MQMCMPVSLALCVCVCMCFCSFCERFATLHLIALTHFKKIATAHLNMREIIILKTKNNEIELHHEHKKRNVLTSLKNKQKRYVA